MDDCEQSELKDSKRRSKRLAGRPKTDLTIELQATALLMKKCGILPEDKLPDQGVEEEFRNQFVEPLVDGTVTNYREAFGLPTGEGADSFSAIVIHAEA